MVGRVGHYLRKFFTRFYSKFDSVSPMAYDTNAII